MTVIFNYLFSRTAGGYIPRLALRLPTGERLAKGLEIPFSAASEVGLDRWEGHYLDITIQDGVYQINGLERAGSGPPRPPA